MPIAGFVRVRARIQHKHACFDRKHYALAAEAHDAISIFQCAPCGCRIDIMLNDMHEAGQHRRMHVLHCPVCMYGCIQ